MDLEVKIKRFVELSLEFSVDRTAIYPNHNFVSYHTLTDFTVVRDRSDEGTTPLKELVKECAEKVKKAERFEEYLKLQKQFTKYFTAKEELNK
jgi:hypothetical protein